MFLDWQSPVGHKRAVRISYLELAVLPDTAGLASLDWRGLSHHLSFGLMAVPTLDCLVKMVQGEVPAITEEQPPRYLIGATATGQRSLRIQGGTSRRLALEDMVVLRADGHVEAWVLSSGDDPLDLLVVVERLGLDSGRPTPDHPQRGEGGNQRGSTAGGRETSGGATSSTAGGPGGVEDGALSDGFFARHCG